MKIFFGCLSADLKRACLSTRFIVSVFFMVGVFCFSAMQSISMRMPWITTYAEGTNLTPDSFNVILLLPISILPGAILFCEDWDTKYYRFLCSRSSIRKYSISKIITCIVSTILISFIGRIIFFILITMITPLETSANTINSQIVNLKQGIGVFPNLYLRSANLEEINIFTFFLLTAFTFSLLCAFVGLLSLIISIWTNNLFIVVGAPVVIYCILRLVSNFFGLPYKFNPIYLGIAHLNCDLNGIGVIVLFTSIYFIILCAISGAIFSRSIRRKIQNE